MLPTIFLNNLPNRILITVASKFVFPAALLRNSAEAT
jgi:hypothetical protein